MKSVRDKSSGDAFVGTMDHKTMRLVNRIVQVRPFEGGGWAVHLVRPPKTFMGGRDFLLSHHNTRDDAKALAAHVRGIMYGWLVA